MGLFAYLQSTPVAFVLTAALMGLMVGSFLNVVIYRLPKMMEREWRSDCENLSGKIDALAEDIEPFNLVRPGSHCPHCSKSIKAWENIPLISYLFLRGKCPQCSNPISLRYPAIEVLSALVTAVAAWHFGYGLQAVAAITLGWALIALTFIDVDHQLLPDSVTLPFLWLGLIFSLFNIFATTQDSIIGAVAGYLTLWTIFHVFRLLTGKEGMGYGDFKLLALFGAWLGWQYLPLIILLSSLVGAAIGIALILVRRHEKSVPIPFGPYLASAGWIALLWGDQIIARYLQFVSPG